MKRDYKVTGVLHCLVHRLDEARPEWNVVILDDDLVALFGQDAHDLPRKQPRRLRKKSELPAALGMGLLRDPQNDQACASASSTLRTFGRSCLHA